MGSKISLIISLILVAACENKWDQMSEKELRERYEECQGIKNPQPGTAIACENIVREYEKRYGS